MLPLLLWQLHTLHGLISAALHVAQNMENSVRWLRILQQQLVSERFPSERASERFPPC